MGHTFKFPFSTPNESAPKTAPAEAAGNPADRSRKRGYFDGFVELAKLQEDDIANEVEYTHRLKAAKTTYKESCKEDDPPGSIDAVITTANVIKGRAVDMQAEVARLQTVYESLKDSLERLDSKPSLVSNTQTEVRQLMRCVERLSAELQSAGVIVDVVEKNMLRAELQRLAFENDDI